MSFIEKIAQQLQNEPLPGRNAQFKMQHFYRSLDYVIPETAKKAAVMLLIYPKNEALHTVLIQRTSTNQNDKHSGQISFPGGKLEKNDESMAFCAKRETFEEIGVPTEDIELLGALTPIYIPVSDFHVFPFVGFVEKEPFWQKQQSEVVEVLQVPLFHFLEEKNEGKTTINVQGFTLQDVPYFDVFGKKVWGATAMILSEMNEVLKMLK